MNTQLWVIELPNEKIGKVIWNYLLSLGFTQHEDFRFHNAIHKTYIWVNYPSGKLAIADNAKFAPGSKGVYNASTDFGAIVENITYESFSKVGEFKFYTDGTVTIGERSGNHFYACYSKDAFDNLLKHRDKVMHRDASI